MDPHHKDGRVFPSAQSKPCWAGDADVENTIPAWRTLALPLAEAGDKGAQRGGWEAKDFQSFLGMRKAFALMCQYFQA